MYYDIVILGVIVSLLLAEFTGFVPAGLVVPGYLVWNLKNPERIVYTLAVALLTLLIVKVLSRYLILYGRRSFAAAVLVSFALDFLLSRSGLLPFAPDMIGILVAGITAREMERQGILQTLLALGIVTLVLALVLLLLDHPVLR